MKQIKRDHSQLSPKRWVSIHDARLTQIVCNENSVEFHFAKGFTVIDGNSTTQTNSGYIELGECSSDDFFCQIVNRKASRKGMRFRGKSISLLELGQMLEQKGKSVEIYIEIYNTVFLHWRGELYPYKKRGLGDVVVIETADFSSMTYYWEE